MYIMIGLSILSAIAGAISLGIGISDVVNSPASCTGACNMSVTLNGQSVQTASLDPVIAGASLLGVSIAAGSAASVSYSMTDEETKSTREKPDNQEPEKTKGNNINIGHKQEPSSVDNKPNIETKTNHKAKENNLEVLQNNNKDNKPKFTKKIENEKTINTPISEHNFN